MKTVLLLSGGLDSTVMLARKAASYGDILALSFDYGQTHRAKELAAAKQIAAHYGVEHRVIGMSSVVLPSALTGTVDIPETHAETPDSTTVPARNMIFISIAAAVAEAEEAQIVCIGTNASDHAGYADCRPAFIRAMWDAVRLGTDSGVTLSAPLSHMSKREIVAVGQYLNAPMHLSWSCYRGGDQPCHRCGACEERDAVL